MNLSDVLDVSKRRVVPAMRERGAFGVLRQCAAWGGGYVAGRFKLTEASKGSFTYDGQELAYHHEVSHFSWMGERNAEIALAKEFLKGREDQQILEIGNVTAHYLDVSHPVVDKYEKAAGVRNLDVVDIDDPEGSYDAIMAISTLEHVGFDEDVKDPEKPARAVEKLKSLLRPGGTLWVTHPVNYNPALDEGLRSGSIPFDSLRALRREEKRNVWHQVALEDVWDARYDWFVFAAHGLVVAEWTRPLH